MYPTSVLYSRKSIDAVDHVGHVLLVQVAGGTVAVKVEDVKAL